MVKKLLLILFIAAAVSVEGLGGAAYAHFIVEDTSTGIKALFHVTPDHDPIAGKESVISFDFSKTGVAGSDYSYSLRIKPTKGEATTVPLEVTSNVVMATYLFPSQGFYDITLTATSKKDGSISNLHYGQRVSRGVVVEQQGPFGIFQIAAIVGAILAAVGGVAYGVVTDTKKRKGI